MQPDVGWCGGLTTLVEIAATPNPGGNWWCHTVRLFTPTMGDHLHQYAIQRIPDDQPGLLTMRPQFDPILLNEPVPVNGLFINQCLINPVSASNSIVTAFETPLQPLITPGVAVTTVTPHILRSFL